MAEWSEEEQQKIIAVLTERGAVRPCARCGNPTFGLGNGYVFLPLAHDLEMALLLTRNVLPAAVVICNKCGNVTLHALGTLGLLPPKDGVTPPAPTSPPESPPGIETTPGADDNE